MNEIFNSAIKDNIFKHAVVLTGTHEVINYHMAFGTSQLDAAFKLGTLAEAMCISTSMMFLTAEHNINLNSTVAKYMPAFGEEGKDKVTLKQLLKHTSGLPETRSYLNEGLSRIAIAEKACYESLEFPPAFERKYSKLGYIILETIIEKISDMPLEQFFAEKIAKPLNLINTAFAPPTATLAPTDLISTAEDCWKIASAVLASYNEKISFFTKSVLDNFIGMKARYKLGWETGEPPLPPGTIGMLSDTGCALWMDLKNNRIYEVFTSGGNRETLQKWFVNVYPELINASSDISQQL